jgi:hypothetical protein
MGLDVVVTTKNSPIALSRTFKHMHDAVDLLWTLLATKLTAPCRLTLKRSDWWGEVLVASKSISCCLLSHFKPVSFPGLCTSYKQNSGMGSAL